MKKKIWLFILCLFLVTGCDVQYSLTIDNDSFDENITMSFLKRQTDYEDVSVYLENKTPVSTEQNESKFYNSKIEENNDYYNLVYDYKHDINTIKNSYFIGNCYPNFSINSSDEEINFSSGSQFNCFNGDDGLQANSIQIKITTKLKVLENNADSISGNTYIWNIDKNNYENKNIKMRLQKSFELEKVVKNNQASYLTFIIVAFILLIALIIWFIVKHKSKKNNDI